MKWQKFTLDPLICEVIEINDNQKPIQEEPEIPCIRFPAILARLCIFVASNKITEEVIVRNSTEKTKSVVCGSGQGKGRGTVRFMSGKALGVPAWEFFTEVWEKSLNDGAGHNRYDVVLTKENLDIIKALTGVKFTIEDTPVMHKQNTKKTLEPWVFRNEALLRLGQVYVNERGKKVAPLIMPWWWRDGGRSGNLWDTWMSKQTYNHLKGKFVKGLYRYVCSQGKEQFTTLTELSNIMVPHLNLTEADQLYAFQRAVRTGLDTLLKLGVLENFDFPQTKRTNLCYYPRIMWRKRDGHGYLSK